METFLFRQIFIWFIWRLVRRSAVMMGGKIARTGLRRLRRMTAPRAGRMQLTIMIAIPIIRAAHHTHNVTTATGSQSVVLG